MHDLIRLLAHLIATVFRVARPGGLRSVVAESVLLKDCPAPPYLPLPANTAYPPTVACIRDDY
jgi:hypothetical protein